MATQEYRQNFGKQDQTAQESEFDLLRGGGWQAENIVNAKCGVFLPPFQILNDTEAQFKSGCSQPRNSRCTYRWISVRTVFLLLV
jgi:hypothetical protein